MPINIAIGPSFHYLPPALSDGQSFLPGIAMEAFVVLSPEVMKENRNRIPRNWRGLISLDQEMHVKPLWLTLFPMTVLIHPGKSHEAWVATWSLFGANWNVNPTPSTQLQAGIKLPTVSWAWIKSPLIQGKDRTFLGLGVSPGVQALWRISPTLQLSASWDEHIYLPIATTTYAPVDRHKEQWTLHGVFSLLVHVRIPSKQKI